MGKVYIGVTAVGGYKLWGVGGEWWKINGRRRKVAGRACPAPTGWRKGERVLVEWAVGEVTGHCCVCCRIRSKISLRILCKSRILLL